MTKAVIAADREASSSRQFFKNLDKYFGASIGVLFIRTREIERARTLIHEWCSLQEHEFHVWDHNHGIRRYPALPTSEVGDERNIVYDSDRLESLTGPNLTVDQTMDIVSALDFIEKRKTPTLGAGGGGNDFGAAMVCTFIDTTSDEIKIPNVVQHIRDHVLRAHNDDDRLFFLVPPHFALPDEVQADTALIDLEPPSFMELKQTLSELAESSIASALDGFELSEDDQEEIAQNGLGMTEAEFSNAVSLATVELANESEEPTITDFVQRVRGSKLEMIRQTEVLDLIQPASLDSVGGLDLLKADLLKQRTAFAPEARAYGLDMPKGFIVVGSPGTGKSLICKATSNALGLPAIIFNLSAVYSSYVGSSEQRFRANLKLVESMAPCIMFLDEFDKAVPQGNENDSGTSSRVLGTLLTWLNDRQERGVPVYVIASANDVSRLPPEVMRKGRFDNIWAVAMPSEKERFDILRIHARKRGHDLTDTEYKRAAQASRLFVGAELESVIVEALLNDYHDGNEKLTADNVIKAIDKTTPQAKAFPERIAFMENWAATNARMASSGENFTPEASEPGQKRRIRTKPRPLSGKSRSD